MNNWTKSLPMMVAALAVVRCYFMSCSTEAVDEETENPGRHPRL